MNRLKKYNFTWCKVCIKFLSYGVPLPRPVNDNGARIFFMKFEGDIAKGLVDMEDLYSVVTAMQEIILWEDPCACINGIIFMIDLKNITMNLVLKITPGFLKKIVQFFEKSLPYRVKGFHLINTPTFFHAVINIFLPMFSEKIQKRVKMATF